MEILILSKHLIFLRKINKLSGIYLLTAELKNEKYFNHIQTNHFYNLNIKYLLPAKRKEFLISISHAQLQQLNDNKMIFTVDKNYSIPFLHLKIFDWIENKLERKCRNRAWRMLDDDNKYLWLRLNYYFYQNKICSYPNEKIGTYTINGYFCRNKLDFLCELGEILLGSSGYVGSDLDGLYDTLTGGINVNFHGVHIIWTNHNYSKIKIGSDFNKIVDVIKSVPYIKLTLK